MAIYYSFLFCYTKFFIYIFFVNFISPRFKHGYGKKTLWHEFCEINLLVFFFALHSIQPLATIIDDWSCRFACWTLTKKKIVLRTKSVRLPVNNRLSRPRKWSNRNVKAYFTVSHYRINNQICQISRQSKQISPVRFIDPKRH